MAGAASPFASFGPPGFEEEGPAPRPFAPVPPAASRRACKAVLQSGEAAAGPRRARRQAAELGRSSIAAPSHPRPCGRPATEAEVPACLPRPRRLVRRSFEEGSPPPAEHGGSLLQRRHSIGDPSNVPEVLSQLNGCAQQPLVATVQGGLATLPDGRVALQPSGPRQAGQGCEDVEQGVVLAEALPSGGAVVRITLLAAGFVIGPSGSSIRDICKLTGANIKSWTVNPDGMCPRPARQFVVDGPAPAVAAALGVVCDAVARYKELCEGKYAGQSVPRLQRVSGMDFAYQPPPRNIVPFAASLRGQGGRRQGACQPAKPCGPTHSHTSSLAAAAAADSSDSSSCAASPVSGAGAGSGNNCGGGRPPMHPSFKDALTRTSSSASASRAARPGHQAPHAAQHADAAWAAHDEGAKPSLGLARSTSVPAPASAGGQGQVAPHPAGSPPLPAGGRGGGGAAAGSRTGSLARAASEGALPPFHTPAPAAKLEKEDVIRKVFGSAFAKSEAAAGLAPPPPHPHFGHRAAAPPPLAAAEAEAAAALAHALGAAAAAGLLGDAAAVLPPGSMAPLPGTHASASPFADVPAGGPWLRQGLPPRLCGAAAELSALSAAIRGAQQRQAEASEQLRQLSALAAAVGAPLTPSPTPAMAGPLPPLGGLFSPPPERAAGIGAGTVGIGAGAAAAAAAQQQLSQQVLAALQALQIGAGVGRGLGPMEALGSGGFASVESSLPLGFPPGSPISARSSHSSRSSPSSRSSVRGAGSSPATPRGQPTVAQAATPFGDFGLPALSPPFGALPHLAGAGPAEDARLSPFAAPFVPSREASKPGSPGTSPPATGLNGTLGATLLGLPGSPPGGRAGAGFSPFGATGAGAACDAWCAPAPGPAGPRPRPFAPLPRLPSGSPQDDIWGPAPAPLPLAPGPLSPDAGACGTPPIATLPAATALWGAGSGASAGAGATGTTSAFASAFAAPGGGLFGLSRGSSLGAAGPPGSAEAGAAGAAPAAGGPAVAHFSSRRSSAAPGDPVWAHLLAEAVGGGSPLEGGIL
eukprot:scaffold14.g1213.t1